MAREIPTASRLESLSFTLVQLVPSVLQGLFTRRPFWVGLCTRFDVDRRAQRLCRRLKAKYGSDLIYVGLRSKQLVVFGRVAIRQVLDASPEDYGPPGTKERGMGHFQPGAVTISLGDEWQERRRFNAAVLDSGQEVHRCAGHFLEIVRAEVEATRAGAGAGLSWEDFAGLFERLTLQVIFGRGARDETELTADLKRMMSRANTPVLLRESKHAETFFGRIRRHLLTPQEGSLMELASATESTEATRRENQVPHWMFAMNETLAANCARTLAVIASHPQVEEKVREEMAGADLAAPEGIGGLGYLKGCLLEAMRLWPTTPLVARLTLRDTELAGAPVPADTQVVIPNTFNHRDQDVVADAEAFVPERWQEQSSDYQFNHFSNGPQVCAGMDLALWLGRAVVAELLANDRYTLLSPRLAADAPPPSMLNYFALRWSRRPEAD